MAYNFIPTTVKEIKSKITKQDIAMQISSLLLELQKKFPTIKDPLALDAASPKNIKVTRKISTMLDLKSLQKKYNLIKLTFGEGSRGGRGTGNQGNLFEKYLADDFKAYDRGDSVSSPENLELIENLYKQYKINSWPGLFVDSEGAANKPRPLMFNGSDVMVSPGLGDIGAVVTDITLRKGTNKSATAGVYLSLKYSSTVTFFNAGTKKYLSDKELMDGEIKNQNGKDILNIFGIDNAIFCSVFNGTGSNFQSVNTTKKVNKIQLEKLIKSGIGYGFHMIHKMNKKIVSKKIDVKYRDEASIVENVVVYYGGRGGNSARVDIEVTTAKYILKFNFRNKQGGKYISHLMCDYSYRS